MKSYSREQSQKYRQDKKAEIDSIFKELEEGVTKIFESDNYKKYLDTLSKFHEYSINNCILIAMQMPDASLVAGYSDWQRKFHRHVKAGEKGITIIAPAPFKIKELKQVTNADGITEQKEVEVIIPSYRTVKVFDVSQTDGQELPSIGPDELRGDVEGYLAFVDALKSISTVPVTTEVINGHAKGYFSPIEQRIVLQEGLSQLQEIKTLIHEIAHSILHDHTSLKISDEEKQLVAELSSPISSPYGSIPVIDYLNLYACEQGFKSYMDMLDAGKSIVGYEKVTPHILNLYESKKVLDSTRNDKEVQAESVAYVVARHFGIDTSDYSFGYIAGWSNGKDRDVLKNNLNTIRKTANSIITGLEKQFELTKQLTPEISVQPKFEHTVKKSVKGKAM